MEEGGELGWYPVGTVERGGAFLTDGVQVRRGRMRVMLCGEG